MHVSIFKGLSNVQDEQDMQGPYERKNQTIDQGTILELNVIGRKDYDNVKLFQSYIPDKEKKTIDESEDILKIKSDLGSDG